MSRFNPFKAYRASPFLSLYEKPRSRFRRDGVVSTAIAASRDPVTHTQADLPRRSIAHSAIAAEVHPPDADGDGCNNERERRFAVAAGRGGEELQRD
jgi:hypothetical protein